MQLEVLKPPMQGCNHGLRTVIHAELEKNYADVALHGGFSDA